MKGQNIKASLLASAMLLSVFLSSCGEIISSVSSEEEKPVSSDPVSSEISTGWLESEDGKYYLKEDGSRATGKTEIEDETYYFNGDGILLTNGCYEFDGSLLVINEEGKACEEGWQDINGKRYYVNPDGSAYKGWLELENNHYYLKDDGTMAKGVLSIDGVDKHFTSAGVYTIMVNPWNYIPEDYEVDLVNLSTSISVEGSKVDSACYDALIEMMADCKDAGNRVIVYSSYRSHSKQTRNFNNKIQRVMNENPELTREEAEIIAATVVARPGTSEHQLGLAVDIIDTHLWDLVEEQEDLPGQKWLMENSWKYGFILRYPKDATDSTGIIYEPWHYRYLGKELAKEVYDSGLTLEEYFDGLTE